jgi:transposase
MSRGRPTKLTPDVQQRMCTVLAAGHTRRVACRAGGVSVRTFCDWMRKGRAELSADSEGIYCNFLLAIKKAEFEALQEHMANLRQAALGGQVLQRTTVVRETATATTTTTVERWSQRQWQASAWWLERKYHEDWGNQAHLIRDLEKALKAQQEQIDHLRATHPAPAPPLEGDFGGDGV